MATPQDIYEKVNYTDVERARKSSWFIEKLTCEMIKNAEKFCKEYYNVYEGHDCPFTYNERSMYSTLAVAAASMTPLHLSEHSAERHFRKAKGKKRQPKKSGRIDFWCHYEGVGYYIELKRAWMSIFARSRKNGKYGNKIFSRSWDSLCNQLKDIKHSTQDEDKAVRVGIMVIYAYTKKRNYLNGHEQWNEKDNKELLDCIKKTLGKKLKFLTLWNLPKDERIIVFDDDDDSKNEFVPVIVFASTYEINKK